MAGSVFVRRRRNGAVRRRSRSRATGSWWRSMGMEKARRNASSEPRRPGLRKSRIAFSSERRFSRGVPVRAARRVERRARTARDCAVPGFLMFCASSRARYSHCDLGEERPVAVGEGVGRDDEVGLLHELRRSRPPRRARGRGGRRRVRLGAKRAASWIQFSTTEVGQTRSDGRIASPASRAVRSVARSWIVLPRPMSSARQAAEPAREEEAEPGDALLLVGAEASLQRLRRDERRSPGRRRPGGGRRASRRP